MRVLQELPRVLPRQRLPLHHLLHHGEQMRRSFRIRIRFALFGPHDPAAVVVPVRFEPDEQVGPVLRARDVRGGFAPAAARGGLAPCDLWGCCYGKFLELLAAGSMGFRQGMDRAYVDGGLEVRDAEEEGVFVVVNISGFFPKLPIRL